MRKTRNKKRTFLRQKKKSIEIVSKIETYHKERIEFITPVALQETMQKVSQNRLVLLF